MCDTLCVVGDGRTLFGKNSDRPRAEAQVLEAHAARPAGGTLRTTYLEIDDTGAHALLGSRPAWMWGFEHGVNEHRVAIGNERVYTTADPKAVPPALTGMDLVRLGLERGATADEALDVITALIAAHGQGGSGEEGTDEPYWSSFLVADPNGAWVLETSERTWVARRVDDGAAISNRVSLGVEWDRSSSDVAPGTDVATWLDPAIPTAASDVRLEATRACVATGAAARGASDIVATLRHHGTRPWGAPGTDGAVEPPPPPDAPGWTGFTVCWHLRGILSTTASIVAELPADPGTAMRVWAALGSPCASVYVPVEVTPDGAPAAMSDPATWARFAALRDRVEDDSSALDGVRAVLGPVEDALWADPGAASDGWPVVEAALARLGV
jgi:secernin